jgi:two-component system NarL family response regulator
MPVMTGIEALAEIRESKPDAKVVILTSFGVEEDIYRALQAGAKGFLMKDATATTLFECISSVASGRKYLAPAVAALLANRFDCDSLSKREMEVLALLADGMSNKLISRSVGVSEGTIKFHVNNILGKFGVTSRTAALNIAIRRGLVRI